MIRFENVSLQLSNKLVLKNFSFEIRPGEKVRLAGRSGSGKTTFLKLVLGFVKPDAGLIFYNNEEISQKNIWKIRQSIGYVSQDIRLGEGLLKVFLKM